MDSFKSLALRKLFELVWRKLQNFVQLLFKRGRCWWIQKKHRGSLLAIPKAKGLKALTRPYLKELHSYHGQTPRVNYEVYRLKLVNS